MRVKAFKSVVRANLEFYEVANDDQERKLIEKERRKATCLQKSHKREPD